MRVVQATEARPIAVSAGVADALESVSKGFLRMAVDRMSIRRHYVQQPENNRSIARWVQSELNSYGYQTMWQGEFRNLMTVPPGDNRPVVLVGAHYDSVPCTPGADDNASAVAAMLACAQGVAQYLPRAPVCFVAFNREEDDLMGSTEFVQDLLARGRLKAREAHILEMVGYCDPRPGSQRLPRGLPIRLVRDRGDFLAVLGNRPSAPLMDRLMRCAKSCLPEFPVLGLKIYCGLERLFRHLRRSDHAPFWACGIPALMWTDTANFRNPHYHRPSDTPDTLDYDFLANVARLLTAHVILAASRR